MTKLKSGDIFTPQGRLADVENNPNLDFLMNIFNIPRAFGISGFGGNWNVGQHSFATAIIAIFWSRFNKYSPTKRDKLVTLALVHDIHEAASGDILPMLKSSDVKVILDEMQQKVLNALELVEDPALKLDLKVIDLIAFLYEIKQVSPSILNSKKLHLANQIADYQLETIYNYCKEKGLSKDNVQKFLEELDI